MFSSLISIAASSILYTWIWYRPADFMKLVSKSDDPCKVMAFWAHTLKTIQFISILNCVHWTALLTAPWWQIALAVLFVGAGQHLNYLVYKYLGVDGVYYGARFGKNIPWVHGYPYSTMRDPQYIGGILTLIGLSIGVPVEIVAWWIGNYFYLMWVESTIPGNSPNLPQTTPAAQTSS